MTPHLGTTVPHLGTTVYLVVAVIVLVLAAELHGRSQSLAGVSAEDRENVILFATALQMVREGVSIGRLPIPKS